MSSGGQSGAYVNGLQGMRIQNASDVLTQTKLQLIYTTNKPTANGVNAYRSKGIQNSYSFLFQVQRGFRECGGGTGQPLMTTIPTTL